MNKEEIKEVYKEADEMIDEFSKDGILASYQAVLLCAILIEVRKINAG